MPNFSYTIANFQPFTKIKSADVNSRFQDLATFLNGQIGDSNIAANSLGRSTALAVGTANAVVINDNTGKMTDEAQLSPTRGGLGFAPTLSSATAGQVVAVNNAGNGLTLAQPSGATLLEQLGGSVPGIVAGEAITTNDAVSLILNQGTYKVVRCQSTDGTRSGNFWGIAANSATVTPQIVTLTQSASWTTGTIQVTVNNRVYTQAFSSNNDTSMTALATQLAADPDVQSASGSGSPVSAITVTSKGGLTINITSSSSGGAPTLSISTTQNPAGDSVRVQMFGPMSGFVGLTTSNAYYTSSVIGGITDSPGPGAVFVGQAISSTVLFVNANHLDVTFGSNRVWIRTAGTTVVNTAASAIAVTEHFNGQTWSAGVNAPVLRVIAGSSDASAFNLMWLVDGVNTSATITATNYSYDRSAWSLHTTRVSARNAFTLASFNSFLYANNGYDGAANSTTADKFNLSTWASATAWGQAKQLAGNFSINGLLYSAGGFVSTGVYLSVNETRTTADSISTSTAVPVTAASTAASNAPGSLGLMTSISANSGTLSSYTFDSASWSASISASYSQFGETANGQAFGSSGNIAFVNGGANNASAATNASEAFNGVSYGSKAASSTAAIQGVMGTA